MLSKYHFKVISTERCHMSPYYPIDTAFPIYAAYRERYIGQPITPRTAFFVPSNLGMGRSCPQDKMIHFSSPDAEGAFSTATMIS